MAKHEIAIVTEDDIRGKIYVSLPLRFMNIRNERTA